MNSDDETPVGVTLLDTQTGRTAPGANGYNAYHWAYGNGSCDCNRATPFLGLQPAGTCAGQLRFLVVGVEPMPEGSDLVEFNLGYPTDLLNRHFGGQPVVTTRGDGMSEPMGQARCGRPVWVQVSPRVLADAPWRQPDWEGVTAPFQRWLRAENIAVVAHSVGDDFITYAFWEADYPRVRAWLLRSGLALSEEGWMDRLTR